MLSDTRLKLIRDLDMFGMSHSMFEWWMATRHDCPLACPMTICRQFVAEWSEDRSGDVRGGISQFRHSESCWYAHVPPPQLPNFFHLRGACGNVKWMAFTNAPRDANALVR